MGFLKYSLGILFLSFFFIPLGIELCVCCCCLAVLRGLWDISSQTRDQTQALSSESMEF